MIQQYAKMSKVNSQYKKIAKMFVRMTHVLIGAVKRETLASACGTEDRVEALRRGRGAGE